MTFWAHLNCGCHGWKQMMPSRRRPQPPGETARGVMLPIVTPQRRYFPLSLIPSVPICVRALYSLVHVCACVWNESPVLDRVAPPSLLEAVSESLLYMAPPGPTASRSLSQQPLPSATKAGPSIVLSRISERERESDCKSVYYVDTDSALTAL